MRSYLLFILFLSLCSTAVAQQDVQKVLSDMAAYNAGNPQEKLYLHLDKYAYNAGESVWFKVYSTIGVNNLFSNHSNVAYVELIDAEKKVVNSMTIPMVMGLGMGDVKLNDTITEGSYRLRAYTNWMRNYDDKYFYDRTIQIANGRSDNVITTTTVQAGEKDNIYNIQLKSLSGVPLGKTQVRYEVVSEGKSVERKRVTTNEQGILMVELNKKYQNPYLKLRFENLEKMPVNKLIKVVPPEAKNDVQLFPEGGRLLGGTINNIAAKAVSPQGIGVRAKVIFMVESDTAGVIETNDLGMGATNIFIQENSSFSVQAVFEDGTKSDLKMPEVQRSGYSIVVNGNNENKLYAQLNVSNDLVNQKDMYFIVHHLGDVIFVSKQKVSKNELVFSVDKKGMPTGVLTVSLLNDQFIPVVERPIFHFKSVDMLPVVVSLNKTSFNTRDKVKVDMEIGHSSDSVRYGAFSASVVDLGKIQDKVSLAPNILSTLFLNSDLKGYIEKPGFYFEDGKVKLRDLDLLMLTQGWRNIDWAALGAVSKPKFEVEKSLKISGYTKKLGRTKPEPNAKVQLISTKNFMDFLDTTSNEEGYFEFDKLMFPDSVKFLVSARDANKGKNNIDIVANIRERPVIDRNKNWPDERVDINAAYVDEISNVKKYFAELESKGLMEKAIAIEEVVVRASTKKKVAENSSNLNGPGNADQVITAEELETCPSLEMCLAGRLMGVTFQGGIPYNTRGNVPMQVVLDGMYIEGDQLSMINVADIESVEVLRNINYTAVYGMNGGNGLIIITSKTGTSAMRNYVPKGILTFQPQGFYINREFYKPKYDVQDGAKLNRDLRTTIHWEPSVVAGKEGKSTFEFFTSDGTGKYQILIEGLDLSGRILHKVIELDVK